MKPTHILSILALTFVLAEATPCGAQQYNFTTLAGPLGGPGYSDGRGSAARFGDLSGVAVDSVGNIYVTEIGNNTIRLGTAVLVTQPLVSANSLFRLADGQFQFGLCSRICG